MRTHRVDIGAVEQILVRGRIIGFDPLDQFVLAQEFARSGTRGFGRDRRLQAVRWRDGL